MNSYSVTIQIKAKEQYFPVVLITMLYKVALTFEKRSIFGSIVSILYQATVTFDTYQNP